MSTTEDHNPSRLGRAEAEEAQVYELGFLILPSIVEDKLSDVVDAIKGIIKKSGGEEIASENPIKIDLAYTMSKTIGARKYVVNDAYIGWVKFESSPSGANEVSDAMKNLDEVLRSLLIKAERETHFTFEGAIRVKEEKEMALKEAQVQASEGPIAEAEKVVE